MIFSVVIPLYNKAWCIELTLASVLAQTYSDFEVIVVDDGSFDGGADVAGSIQDSRIHVLRQANAGVSAARNAGIAAARGEWVAFLDADDWWHPQYLARQLETIQSFPQLDMVTSYFRAIPHCANWRPLPWPIEKTTTQVELIDDLPRRWMRSHPFFTSSVAVRRSRLVQMQPCFPPGESCGEDMDLWFRLAEKTNIAHSDIALAAYRTLQVDSLSSTHAFQLVPPYLKRMRDRAWSGTVNPNQRASALWFIAQLNLTNARYATTAGERQAALRHIWQARSIATGRRWWLTLLMALFIPGSLVRRWQAWREHRSFA